MDHVGDNGLNQVVSTLTRDHTTLHYFRILRNSFFKGSKSFGGMLVHGDSDMSS